jgi:hypothetical protein
MTGKGRFRVGLPLAVALFSLLATGFQCGEPVEVSLGQPFALKVGQGAVVSSEKLRIRFASVPQDSRCPKGEQCITAGEVRVALEVSAGDAAPAAVELGTSEEMDVAGFQVRLVGLEPYPVSGRPLHPEEYVATLVLRRL